MSLRVLLADESDTIKKVFQLALQDLNAEIKSVHSGLDVIDVAQSFKPDVIFTDVLLQKKNGYETCREIKQNPQLANTPVILMWSSFMELDQAQYKKSSANDQLEKPFDADFLRELIKKYVPQSQENPLGQFLNFPKNISTGPKAETKPASAPPLPETPQEDTSEFNLASFLDKELTNVPSRSDLKLPNAPEPLVNTGPKDESWMSTDLSQFKIDLEAPADNLEKFETFNLGERSLSQIKPQTPTATPAPTAKPSPYEITSVPLATKHEITTPPLAIEELDEVTSPSMPLAAFDQLLNSSESLHITAPHRSDTKTKAAASTTAGHEALGEKRITAMGMGNDEIEAIIRAHTEEIIKTQILDNIGYIIERVVRDELSKILDEEVRLKQDLSHDNR